MIWVLIYNLLIRLFVAVIRLASLFGEKPRKWVQGRKDWEKNLETALYKLSRTSKNKLIWVHASSVGEFEQAKPIIHELKANNPDLLFVVSFFSPSGYEANKKETIADIICYLPSDTSGNASRFIFLVQPDLVIWVKYEYWFHFLNTLHEKGIHTLLISAIFQKNQVFFKWYGILHRRMLGFFNHLFLQNEDSLDNLRYLIKTEQMTIAGDTRFDRVLEITKNFKPIPEVENWLGNSEKVLIAGSTWPEDEKILASLLKRQENITCIIAPHHVDEASLQKTMLLFPGSMRLSQLINEQSQPKSKVLIADTIGHLSRLYNYATISYVGGGFSTTGIHNILEPAVYGKPVLFGPNFQKYAEAEAMISFGGGFTIENEIALDHKLNELLTNKPAYEKAAKDAASFIRKNAGATKTVTAFIYRNRLLTR